MRIGVTVHFQFSFFSAGCPQSALSVAESLRIKGHTVFFVNVGEKERTWWEDVKGVASDWTSVHASDLTTSEQAKGDLVIEVGNSLLTPAQRCAFTNAVWFFRKPLIFNEIESCLYPYENTRRNLTGISEVWMTKEHTTCKASSSHLDS